MLVNHRHPLPLDGSASLRGPGWRQGCSGKRSITARCPGTKRHPNRVRKASSCSCSLLGRGALKQQKRRLKTGKRGCGCGLRYLWSWELGAHRRRESEPAEWKTWVRGPSLRLRGTFAKTSSMDWRSRPLGWQAAGGECAQETGRGWLGPALASPEARTHSRGK